MDNNGNDSLPFCFKGLNLIWQARSHQDCCLTSSPCCLIGFVAIALHRGPLFFTSKVVGSSSSFFLLCLPASCMHFYFFGLDLQLLNATSCSCSCSCWHPNCCSTNHCIHLSSPATCRTQMLTSRYYLEVYDAVSAARPQWTLTSL